MEEEKNKQRDQYMGTLRALEKVRKRMVEASKDIGADKVPTLRIPQICAVGDQSSGKSALMEAISGIPFPQSTGTCTKCPIVVDMQPLGKEEGTESRFYIDDVPAFTKDEVREAIRNRQSELTRNETSGFSSLPINIKATTTHPHRLVCVDLPGIIHNAGEEEQENAEKEEGKEKAGKVGIVRELIQENISPTETLIVVVTPSSQDEELATALKLANVADKTKCRTLRVYTKCDVKESEEQQAALRKKLKDAAKQLHRGNKLAPHFVAVRNQKGKLNADDENKMLKDELGLDPEDMCVVGQGALADRLEPLLSERISENLISLHDQISKHKQSAQSKLRMLGEHPMCYSDILSVLEKELTGRLRGLENELSKLIKIFREDVHNTKEEADNEKKSHLAFSDTYTIFSSPFFQGEDALLKRVGDICGVWVPLAKDLVKKVADLVKDASNLSQEIQSTALLSDDFRREVEKESNRFARDILTKLEVRVMASELEKELRFGTLNHYLTSKFEVDMKVPPQLIKSVLESLTKDDFAEGATTAYDGKPKSLLVDFQKSKALNTIVEAISSRMEARYSKFAAKSLEEQQQERLAKAVTAYWAVMHKTFLDNVLKAVRDVALLGMKNWIQPGLRAALKSQEGNKLEHPRVAEQREILSKVAQLMDECEQDLRF